MTVSDGNEERSHFWPRAAILVACAFSAYVGYFAGSGLLRAKFPFAGWIAPAFPLVCLLLPEGPRMKPDWPAKERRKLQQSYTVLRVSFAWMMAIACAALATDNATWKAFLLIAISCSLGALFWAGRKFNAAKKALQPLQPVPAAHTNRAGVDFLEDACPHCGAKLAVFPEDGDRLRCACGAVLKVERSGSAVSLSVAELP
jgi:ribosomal protein S27E